MTRKFRIVVTERKLIYPPLNGERALQCMRVLRDRGYETTALTSANGIDESLALAEMEAACLEVTEL
jgi:hypothetical protein